MYRVVWLACLLGSLLLSGCAVTHTPLGDSRQLVVVVADDWQSTQGQLYAFERQGSRWQPTRLRSAVNLGRSGLAWGLGLHPAQPGATKQEGDGKAPAGIFRLTEAFGYLPTLPTHLPYRQMQADSYCIDVNGSPLYNQIVRAEAVGQQAVAESTEPMRRDIHKQQDIYKKGILVEHNPQNISAKGSCIFMHIWFERGVATAGCTAMPEGKLDALLAWLAADKHPLMVLLPVADYRKFRQVWQLPALPADDEP